METQHLKCVQSIGSTGAICSRSAAVHGTVRDVTQELGETAQGTLMHATVYAFIIVCMIYIYMHQFGSGFTALLHM